MKTAKEILDIINSSTGTENYHKFIGDYPLATDGVIAVAQAAECFWLLDMIASYQKNSKLDKYFQVWKLKVNKESDNAILTGYNDTKLIITQKIEYTNFPLKEIEMFFIDGVILLPNEY
jgi:hypothetical protein